jgi:uncharacterized protein
MLREARLKFTRELSATLTVRSVDEHGIRINDELWTETIALTHQKLMPGWTSKAVQELLLEDFAPLLEEEPELVLLGTGRRNEFPPRDLVFGFARMGIGLEVMETSAAARTFNVLAGEGRQVAAVLILDENA